MGLTLWLAFMFGLMAFYTAFEPQIKGWLGERHVSNLLTKLNPQFYSHINDIYIPKENGQTTQVDHILISDKGIFVIETKNYKGWILGGENSQKWTQVNFTRKNKFPNPIWQNSGHIKAMEEYLGDVIDGVPIYSVIVFLSKATLKFKVPFKKAIVVNSVQLLSTLEVTGDKNSVALFKQKKIEQLLSQLKIKDKKAQKEQRKKHISDIKQNLDEKNTMVLQNKCPRCGGDLVQRSGKRGSFKGCSNFPKCRFIA